MINFLHRSFWIWFCVNFSQVWKCFRSLPLERWIMNNMLELIRSLARKLVSSKGWKECFFKYSEGWNLGLSVLGWENLLFNPSPMNFPTTVNLIKLMQLLFKLIWHFFLLYISFFGQCLPFIENLPTLAQTRSQDLFHKLFLPFYYPFYIISTLYLQFIQNFPSTFLWAALFVSLRKFLRNFSTSNFLSYSKSSYILAT